MFLFMVLPSFKLWARQRQISRFDFDAKDTRSAPRALRHNPHVRRGWSARVDSTADLNRDRRLDGGMRLVGLEDEVFVLEFQQLAARRVQAHARKGTR